MSMGNMMPIYTPGMRGDGPCQTQDRQSWDVHADTSFNIGTAMEHHQCFHIYILKTRATRISNTEFFKHQYITNPPVTPITHVIKAAL